MARVSENNQQDRRGDGTARQPRMAMLIRSNGTWREVAFERRTRPFPPGASALATSASQER